PGAMQVSWREEAEHYFVHFTQASAVSEIEYDQEGNFISSFRYYKSPDLLPVHIICRLNKKFKDKAIFGITEFSTGSETNYYIKLEDPQRFTTVRAGEDGSLVVTEKLRKQAG
ncbi:MAG: hypothetical protein ABUL46_05850, partial [Chitinophaga rupis]